MLIEYFINVKLMLSYGEKDLECPKQTKLSKIKYLKYQEYF